MDANGLYPIYGMWHIPFWQTRGFYTAVIAVSVLSMMILFRYGIKKYRNTRKKRKSPWVSALDELTNMQQELMARGMLGKTFYFRLSWVFKRYLSERYGFKVYGKTDDELILYLEGTGLSVNFIQDLKVIFEGSTVIKFANQEAAKERMSNDLATSIALINKTIPDAVKR